MAANAATLWLKKFRRVTKETTPSLGIVYQCATLSLKPHLFRILMVEQIHQRVIRKAWHAGSNTLQHQRPNITSPK